MRVIGTLVLLAAAAFVLGAGAGLLWKEPRLILAHWLGDTEEVAWSQPGEAPVVAGDAAPEALPEDAEAATSSDAPAADVAAAPPAAAKPAPDAAKPAEKPAAPVPAQVAAKKPGPPPVSSPPPPQSGVSVQVGAFAERGSADALVKKLKGQGFPAYVASGDRAPWRVRVGPYRDRTAAEAPAAKLAKQSLPTWVLEEGSGR